MYDLEGFQVVQAYIALWVKANGKRAIGISELCLSFSSHPDENSIPVPHFNRPQIFQIVLQRPKKHILILIFPF